METLKKTHGVTLKHGGLEFHGRTLTDAKANRDAWLDQLGNRPAHPNVLVLAGVTLIVSCDCTVVNSSPWSYRLVYPANLNGDSVNAWVGSSQIGHTSETLAEEAGRRHIAQTVYVPGSGAASVLGLLRTDSARAEIASWCAWQDRFAAAKARGLDDNECRKAANAAPAPVKAGGCFNGTVHAFTDESPDRCYHCGSAR